jgi:hypothetical protein
METDFVPHIIPRRRQLRGESWSEWQDLNLRPLVLNEERVGAAQSDATERTKLSPRARHMKIGR